MKKHNSWLSSINIGFYDLIPKETCITKWKKLPAKKNYLKSKKYRDSEGQETFAFFYFTDFEQVLGDWVISLIFSFLD